MSQFTHYAPGTPCWIDLATSDLDAAQEFYTSLFGWTYNDAGEEFGHYNMVMLKDQPVAGMMRLMPEQEAQGVPPSWTTHLASDSVDATEKLIRDGGGAILAGPMDIPQTGRMLVAQDPTGAVFGVWEDGGHPGSALGNEPGAFTWNELVTRDVQGAFDFYASVFHYGRQEMDFGGQPYIVFKVNDRGVGGMTAMPPGVSSDIPPYWLTYFAVTSTDAAVDNARSQGGTVLTDPMDSPYGRWATLQDPQGAVFTVMTAPQEGTQQA
jgi:predicted enzyme related to lactoylglutathione lyase